MKERLLNEISRRIEAETDKNQRVKLLVLMKAVEADLVIEPVGEIVDISGEVFRYATGLLRTHAEFVGDPLTHIAVFPIVDNGGEAFTRFAESANKAGKVLEHEKETHFKLLCSYFGVSGCEQPG